MAGIHRTVKAVSMAPAPYVAVVGAVNVDIWGRAQAALRPKDSNPGEIHIALGGVGRNIAHNLRLLGTEVQFLTVFGGDVWAGKIEESCRSLGIGLERALRIPNGRSSTYLYITGPEGELELAVCDADIAHCITPAVLRENLDMLCGAAAVVFDGNLTQEAIQVLTEECSAPLFADPVSAAKAGKLRPFLSRIHTIKPNALEAAVLTEEKNPCRAAEMLLQCGVKRCFVSDGPRGMYAGDKGGVFHLPCCPVERVCNTTGSGDAVVAALVHSYLSGRSVLEGAQFALAAGALAVECEETINPSLSELAVLDRCTAAWHGKRWSNKYMTGE